MAEQLQDSLQTIRIPWYAADMQRLYAQGNYFNKRTGVEQDMVNCFPIVYKDPIRGDAGTPQIVSRAPLYQPEMTVDLTGVVGNADRITVLDVITMTQLTDVLVVAYEDASDSKIYIVQYRSEANTCLKIGEITGYTTHHVKLTELDISNTPYVAVAVYPYDTSTTTSAGYYAATTSGLFTASSLTEITDTDFPPKQTPARPITGGFVQMDGYTFILTKDSYIYNSDINSISSWNTSANLKAGSKPDQGVCLVRYKHHIIACGDNTIEFFNNIGTAPPASPLERTQQAFISMGVAGPKAIINVDDVLYFLAHSSNNALGLWKIEGYTPILLSQPYQSYMAFQDRHNTNLQVFSMYGVRHIIMNSWRESQSGWVTDPQEANPVTPENDELWSSLVYCIDSKAWWNFALECTYRPVALFCASSVSSSWSPRYFFWFAADAADLDGVTQDNYGAHPTYHTQLYEPNSSGAYYDTFRDGNATTLLYWRIPVQVITNIYDFGTRNRKTITRAYVVADDIVPRMNVPASEPDVSFISEGLTYRFGWSNLNSSFFGGAVTSDVLGEENLWKIRNKSIPFDTDFADSDIAEPQTRSRYYFNNLGTGREWKFVFNCNAIAPIRLDSLELTISKRSH
jgi:hypothetical protein